MRLVFRERYAHFKQLISANNKALEIMADIEGALEGDRPFGMSLVRSSVTTVSVNVFQMVDNLQRLAPDKYEALTPRFNAINRQIESLLRRETRTQDERLVIGLNAIDKNMVDLVGRKMANLGEIRNKLNQAVPSGFVITATAYERFIAHNDLKVEIERLMQSADQDDIENLYRLHARLDKLIVQAAIPPNLATAVQDAWGDMERDGGSGMTAAMRSSALAEEMPGLSFAGQYRSELNVSGESILEAYKEIVASKYSLQAMAYRLNRGIREEDVAMCVACMTMVDAAAGGVMYSGNPGDIRDHSILISSVWGLPKAVVDGTTPSDLFIISRDESMKILRKDIAGKKQKFVCYPREGICRMDTTGNEAIAASLSDVQAMELARIALRLGSVLRNATGRGMGRRGGRLYYYPTMPAPATHGKPERKREEQLHGKRVCSRDLEGRSHRKCR